MRNCKCGNQVADNARACPKCGHRFTGAFTKFVAWIFAGSCGLILLLVIIGTQFDTPSAAPSSSTAAPLAAATPAAVPANATSAQEAKEAEERVLEVLNRSAIELCKDESLKRQPNAKGYIATGHYYDVRQKDTFHVEVEYTLGLPDYGGGHYAPISPVMTSDCRIVRKNDKMSLIKINFTFAN